MQNHGARQELNERQEEGKTITASPFYLIFFHLVRLSLPLPASFLHGVYIPAPAIPASPIISQMAQNNLGLSAVPNISPAAPKHVAGAHRADAWWMRSDI